MILPVPKATRFTANKSEVYKLPVHGQVRHYFGAHHHDGLDNPLDLHDHLKRSLKESLRCIHCSDTPITSKLTGVPSVTFPTPATSILGACSPTDTPLAEHDATMETLVPSPTTAVKIQCNPGHGVITAWLVITRVPSSSTRHLSMISSPIALDESPPGNAKWDNPYVSGLYPGTVTRFSSATPDSWSPKVQMMILHFPFSPFTLHLGDTTLLPGETNDEDDVDDIAPSLIPVREYFDDNSWASFILPNSFTGITDAAYGGVKPYNTPSSRGNARDILLSVFFPIFLGHDIIPFHIKYPSTVADLVSYFTTEGTSTADTWLCQNPLFVAWFNWASITSAVTVEATTLRTRRISTSYDAKCCSLLIQRIALDSFFATESSKAVVHLQKFLKSSGNNLLTTVNFFSQNTVSGCQKLAKSLLTVPTPSLLYPSYADTSMIASLSNSSVCSRTSANPPIVVVTTDDRMNNPFGSIPVPTTVTHTTAVAPPPMGIHIPPSPIG